MQISHTPKLADGRGHYSIGRIRAAAERRGANAPGGQADRFTAVRVLIREAQEYARRDYRVEISHRRHQTRRY